MAKNYDYSAYYYRRPSTPAKKSKVRGGNVKEIAFWCAAIFAFIIAVYFLFFNFGIKSKAIVLYAVSINSYEKQIEANEKAAEIRTRGGAGYVFYKKKYYVIAAMYLTRNEAASVSAKLLEFSPTVVEIDFRLLVKYQGSTAQENAVKDALDTLAEHLKQLLQIAQDFDAGKIDTAKLVSTFTHLASETESLIGQLNVITSANKNTSAITKLCSCLEAYRTALQTALSGTINNSTTKILYCTVVELTKPLC